MLTCTCLRPLVSRSPFMTTRRGRFTVFVLVALLAAPGPARGGAKRAEASTGRQGCPTDRQSGRDRGRRRCFAPAELDRGRVRQAAAPDRSGQGPRWRRVAIRGRSLARDPGEGGRSHGQRSARAGDGPLRRRRGSRRLSGRLRPRRAGPGFTDRVILLADRRDGKPLSAREGPFQVIVPGEKKHARWVRQVIRLKVGRG